jgi:hypothetical protein
MPRHSDRKSKLGPRVSTPSNPSRRSFLERVVGTGVAAPALMTLTGTWLAGDAVFAQSSTSMAQPSGSLSTSKPRGSISIGSSESAASSSSAPPTILHVGADSTLRADSPNTNEGANPLIRVSVRPVRRGIVQFDPATVAAMREAAFNNTVYLTLEIAANNNNWSQDDQHFVDVHPLPENFWVAEGTGKATGMPPGQIVRGGAGVTWNMPYDADTLDTKKKVTKGMPAQWQGGDLVMLAPTAPGVLHTNGLSGQVSWDVTQDVLNGANAWIVKVRDEDEPASSAERRQQGFDPFRGAVDYFSKEGAAEAIGCAFPPKLQLVTLNSCGSGEQSQSSHSSESSAASMVLPPLA